MFMITGSNFWILLGNKYQFSHQLYPLTARERAEIVASTELFESIRFTV